MSRKRPFHPPGGGKSPRRAQRIPVSIETEIRAVIAVANQTQAELKGFKAEYKLDNVDFGQCKSIALGVLDQVNVESDKVEGVDGFKMLLKVVVGGGKPVVKRTAELDGFELFCDKAKQFEYSDSVRERILDAVDNHLCKYCVSFAEQANDVDIKCVAEYEEHIKDFQEKLEQKSKAIKDLSEEYQKLKSPFITGFCGNANRINEIIDLAVTTTLEVAQIMKKWALQDKAYPQKLWDEAMNCSTQRVKLLQEIKKINKKKEELDKQFQLKQAVHEKALEKLENCKKERKKTQSSKEVVIEKLKREEAELVKKKKELAENEKRMNNRKSNSPTVYDTLSANIDRLKEELVKDEDRVEALRRQQARLVKSEEEANYFVTEHEEAVAQADKDMTQAKEQLQGREGELATSTMTLSAVEARQAAARRVRDSKLSPAALKLLYFQQRQAQAQTDPLSDACALVAAHIGRAWPSLYLTLPFLPARDAGRRLRDIEALDREAVRTDRTWSAAASRALSRWRRLHNGGRITELVRVLHKLDKPQLAGKVEGEFVKPKTVR